MSSCVTLLTKHFWKQEIIALLEGFTKENCKYKEDDSVIVAVLSHGTEQNGNGSHKAINYIYGTDKIQ